MKSWIGEYGKIAAMAIILAVLFAFVWNRTDRGYLGALSKAEPKSFLKATDNSDFLVQLKPRPDPVLTVSVSKLEKELNPEAFWTAQRGVYEITYQAEENYQGAYIRKVTKVCRVTVD